MALLSTAVILKVLDCYPGNYNSQLGIVIPRFQGLRADLGAVLKLLLWTSCSIHKVSLTANLVYLPIKTAGEMTQRLTNSVAREAFRGVSQL